VGFKDESNRMSQTLAAFAPFARGHLGATESLVAGWGKRPRGFSEDMGLLGVAAGSIRSTLDDPV